MEVVVKDLFRHTVACDACRIRKRKCDGKAPCSYCVAKNQPCNFSERKKRGPAKRSRLEMARDGEGSPDSLIAAAMEGQMLDKIEAAQYLEFCWKYVHRIHPLSTRDKLLSPNTVAHKVQAYGTFAYMARICGDVSRAKTYMDQARMLAGSIYDSPEPDSVAGMLIMSIYYALVLEMPRTVHYASVAWSLTRMIGQKNLNPKLRVICQLTQVASSPDLNVDEMSRVLKNIAINDVPKLHNGPQGRGLSLFLDFNSNLTRILGCNMLFPSTTMHSIFQVFDGKTVSEDDRTTLLNNMDSMVNFVTAMGIDHMLFVCNVLCPMYRAIINWKSGHVSEGLAQAMACLQVLKGFDHSHLFGMLSHFPQICILGCLVNFFLEQRQYTAAVQMTEVIKAICKVMSPEFDFIIKLADELVASIPTSLLEYPPFQVPSPNSSSSSSSDDDLPYFSMFNPIKVIASTLMPWNIEPDKPKDNGSKASGGDKSGSNSEAASQGLGESASSPETDESGSSSNNSDNEHPFFIIPDQNNTSNNSIPNNIPSNNIPNIPNTIPNTSNSIPNIPNSIPNTFPNNITNIATNIAANTFNNSSNDVTNNINKINNIVTTTKNVLNNGLNKSNNHSNNSLNNNSNINISINNNYNINHNNIPNNIPTNSPNNAPNNFPNMPNNITNNIPTNIPNNIPTHIPNNNVSNNIPNNNVPNNIPNNIPSNISNNILNNIPSNIPNNIPNNIPSVNYNLNSPNTPDVNYYNVNNSINNIPNNMNYNVNNINTNNINNVNYNVNNNTNNSSTANQYNTFGHVNTLSNSAQLYDQIKLAQKGNNATPNPFSYNAAFFNVLQTQNLPTQNMQTSNPSPPSNISTLQMDPMFYTNPPAAANTNDDVRKNSSSDSVSFEVDFTNANIANNDDVIANILNNADSYLNLPEMEFLLQ